jgi:hypothetical protein
MPLQPLEDISAALFVFATPGASAHEYTRFKFELFDLVDGRLAQERPPRVQLVARARIL